MAAIAIVVAAFAVVAASPPAYAEQRVAFTTPNTMDGFASLFYRSGDGAAVTGLVDSSGFLVNQRGIGPFQAQVVAFQPDGDGLRVSLAVKNEGTSLGSTTCRISDPTSAAGTAAIVQSPRIQPGATLTFDATVTGLGPSPKQLIAECSSP